MACGPNARSRMRQDARLSTQSWTEGMREGESAGLFWDGTKCKMMCKLADNVKWKISLRPLLMRAFREPSFFPTGYKGCAFNKTINPSVRDQTSYPLQNIQKGQCFLHNDWQVGRANARCRHNQSPKYQRKRLTGNVSHLSMVKTGPRVKEAPVLELRL